MYKTKKLLLTAIVVSAALFSCSKDEGDLSDRPPAYYIAQSEKLEIPAAVDLPYDPKGHTRVATYFAEGVQKYKAQQKAGSDPVTYEWVFVAPQADLFNIQNAFVGTHTAGPSWQLTGGMDSIFAQHFTPSRTAPSPLPNTIDWLLLMPKVGKTPTGIFADVDYIQRIATEGGKAPSTLPTSADQTAEVKYIAVYRFTKRN